MRRKWSFVFVFNFDTMFIHWLSRNIYIVGMAMRLFFSMSTWNDMSSKKLPIFNTFLTVFWRILAHFWQEWVKNEPTSDFLCHNDMNMRINRHETTWTASAWPSLIFSVFSHRNAPTMYLHHLVISFDNWQSADTVVTQFHVVRLTMSGHVWCGWRLSRDSNQCWPCPG